MANRKIFNILVGTGSLLITASFIYLLFHLEDRNVLYTMPVVLLGIALNALAAVVYNKPAAGKGNKKRKHRTI